MFLALLFEQADGLDVVLQTRLTQGQNVAWFLGDPEQFGRGLVHALVGRLRRQHHRDQQLKHIAVVQFGGRMRIGGA